MSAPDPVQPRMKFTVKRPFLKSGSPPQNDEKVNLLAQDIWLFTDATYQVVTEIHFENWKITSKLKTLAKLFLKFHFGNYRDNFNRIDARHATLVNISGALRKVFEYATRVHPLVPLSTWTLEDVDQCIKWSVTKGSGGHGEVASNGAAVTITAVFVALRKLHSQGLLPDGIQCQLPRHLKKYSCKALIESKGLSYARWVRGGSHKPVPIEIGMCLLADCLDFIRAPEHRVLLSYFKFQRENELVEPCHMFEPRQYNSTVRMSLFDRLCVGGNLLLKKSEKSEVRPLRKLIKTIEKDTGMRIREFPFRKHSELESFCHEAITRCLVILMCVTGARISELLSLKGGDYQIDHEDVWMFSSNIYKTNMGIATLRSITGVGAEAMDFLAGLGYEDKVKSDLPLCAVVQLKHFRALADGCTDVYRIKTLSRATIADRLREYYESFCSAKDKSFIDEHPHISPHQFRHLFAEFALRRFDGNILEQIRAHFRHRYGSSYSRRYTERKLANDIKEILQKEYAAELISRIVSGEFADFFGPVSTFVRDEVDSSYSVGDQSEIEDMIQALADDCIRVVPHVWGWCLPRRGHESEAQCFCRKTSLPMVDDQASFAKCSGCRFRLTAKSHQANIEAIHISHSEFVDKSTLPTLAQSSKAVLKRSKIILKEMKSNVV